MEIIEGLAVSNYLVQSIVLLMLVSVLVIECLRRKSNRKGLLPYAAGFLLLIIASFSDSYQTFVLVKTPAIMKITAAIVILAQVIFIWNSIRVWKFINKKLFFADVIIGTSILTLRAVFKLFIESGYEIVIILLFVAVIVVHYFFIVTFLVNTSEKKELKRGNSKA
ncbi:hypothetical protein JXB11_02770 [Candidatus Woesearchaeota archaeon]|nr:hypothetical protein [Candidatus Woesearchaeota archaeon]